MSQIESKRAWRLSDELVSSSRCVGFDFCSLRKMFKTGNDLSLLLLNKDYQELMNAGFIPEHIEMEKCREGFRPAFLKREVFGTLGRQRKMEGDEEKLFCIGESECHKANRDSLHSIGSKCFPGIQ